MSGFYDDASWVLIPEGIKEDVVYAQKPTDGLGDLTFTRASDATRTNSAGVIERTPWNLVTFSEDFSNAVWSAGQNTITANVATSPIGLNNADRLTPNTNNATHFITANQSVSFVSGNSYTISVYAKANGYNFLRVAFNFAAMPIDNRGASFDILNGTVGQTQSGVTAQIQSVGSGWYRCSISRAATATAVDTTPFFINSQNSDSATSVTFTGDGTSGAILWGAQLVEGTDAKPYFATTNRQDVPRLDYRNADGSLNSCPRLLLEPQRTNLLLHSEDFTNAVWSGNIVKTANQTTAPSGQITADLISGNGVLTNQDIIQGTISVTSGLIYTHTIYAKKNTNNFIQLGGGAISFGANYFANFNLNDGTIGTVGSAVTRSSIQSAGDGWYRCSISGPAIATTNSNPFVLWLVSSATASRAELWSTTSSVFLWGAQLEAGAYATTYIPTTTAAVTRVADVSTKTGVSSLIGQTAGTIYGEFNVGNFSTDTRVFIILSNGTTSNLVAALLSGTDFIARTRANSGSVVNVTKNSLTSGTHKFALSYAASDLTLYLDGVFVGQNTSASVAFSAAINEITVGKDIGAGALQLSGGVAQAAIFPTRLTNAQLAEITTL
jgi:hypothetical protein